MTKNALRRILLVDDDPDIRDVAVVLLAGLGDFEVRAYGSALEGLSAAGAFAPDLILLDFMMPGLDGKAAIRALRELPATSAVPVIFMTARVQPLEIAAYRELGSLGVIPKPFDPETFAATIQDMWDRQEKTRSNQARREGLGALRRQYASDLPARLQSIEAAAASLRRDGSDSQAAAVLYDIAQRLAGSAAIHGFPAVSGAAARVSDFASQQAVATRTPLDWRALIELIGALSTALQDAIAAGHPVGRIVDLRHEPRRRALPTDER